MGDDLPEIRASDTDRDRVAEQLRDAMAEGRLTLEEFDERLGAAYRARTYGELETLTRDLPSPGGTASATVAGRAPDTTDWPARIGGEPTSSWAVGVLAGFQRKGRWTVAQRFTSFVFWGGGTIDLREARFAERETVIRCISLMGGVHVLVPPGVEVAVHGFGLMGGFDQREDGSPSEPGAPRVVITGFALWGGVGVTRKRSKSERRRLKEERRRVELERLSPDDELDADRRDDRKELGGG